MTNSYNDIRNAKTLIIMGGNPAEAHPVSLQHLLEARSSAGKLHRDRPTADAHGGTRHGLRARSTGTHIPTIYGMLWHIFKNGWKTRSSSHSASTAWTTSARRSRSGRLTRSSASPACRRRQVKRVAEKFAKERPSTLIWRWVRPSSRRDRQRPRQLHPVVATGNVGGFGNGANIFRGHCNVQGATDLVSISRTCRSITASRRCLEALVPGLGGRLRLDAHPLRLQAADGSGRRSLDPLVRRGDAAEGSGQPEGQSQGDIVFGHGGNTVTRMPEAAKGIEALDLLVVGDPHPTTWAALSAAQERHLSPADLYAVRDLGLAHGVEPLAAVGEQIVKPIFESKDDYEANVPVGEETRVRRPDV